MPHPVLHHGALVVAALLALGVEWRPRAAVGVLGAYLIVLVAAVVAPEQLAPVVEKEGLVEGLTAGALVGWVAIAARERLAFAAVAGAVLLLEELDYGQVFFAFETPELVARLSSTSDQMNFHNIPLLDPIWRAGAFFSVWGLSLPWVHRAPWTDRLTRAGVPTFGRAHWFFVGAILLGVATHLLAGDRVWDELHEAAMVAGALVLWSRRAGAPG